MRLTGGFWDSVAAFGCWVLVAFCGGELLAVDIPTLIPLVFLLSVDFPCLCNDGIKSEHERNSHTIPKATCQSHISTPAPHKPPERSP